MSRPAPRRTRGRPGVGRPTLALAVVGLLVVTGCSGADDDAAPAAQGPPVLTASDAPAGARTVSVGKVSLGVPATMTEAAPQMAPQPGRTSIQYRADGSGGALGAGLIVTVSGPDADTTAEAERDFVVKLHRDIRKNDTVRTSPVELDGFGDAYAVSHDSTTLHTITVVGEIDGGTVVSATATAPRALFDELRLEQSLGSLSVSG